MKLQLFDNPPYMKGWAEVQDGIVSTFVRTGEAVVVLPYRYVLDTNWHSVVLLRQWRPEVGEWAMKTVGGYVRDGETAKECARRNILEKLGIEASELVLCGETQGYTVVEVPVQIFLTQNWVITEDPPVGCERVEMDLDEALELVMTNQVADDSTALPLFRLDYYLHHNSMLAPSGRETRTP